MVENNFLLVCLFLRCKAVSKNSRQVRLANLSQTTFCTFELSESFQLSENHFLIIFSSNFWPVSNLSLKVVHMLWDLNQEERKRVELSLLSYINGTLEDFTPILHLVMQFFLPVNICGCLQWPCSNPLYV